MHIVVEKNEDRKKSNGVVGDRTPTTGKIAETPIGFYKNKARVGITSHFNTGIYTVQLFKNNELMNTQKLSILK